MTKETIKHFVSVLCRVMNVLSIVKVYCVKLPKLILSEFGKAVKIRSLDSCSAVMFDDGITRLWRDTIPFTWEDLSSVDCSTIDEAYPGGTWRTLDLSTVDTTLGLTLDDEHTTDICFRVGENGFGPTNKC